MSFPSLAARRRTPVAAAARLLGWALAGSLLLAVSAHVKVPFWPVPMTLQTLAVLLLGLWAGPTAAVAAVLAYLVEGCLGLPVFAAGVGPSVLAGPTAGFIAGFVPAAILAGWAGRVRPGLAGTATACGLLVAADAAILVLGWAWLATLLGAPKAFAAGIAPFLLGEALKVALATATVQLRPASRR